MTKIRNDSITDIRNMNLMAIFAALTAISAFIKIPLPYVPITLQTVFVLLSGIILGKKRGSISQVIYVLLGLIGLPIFTEGGGPGYILKPSFGYLLGFIAAAYLVGKILEDKKLTYLNTFLASCLGIFIIYLLGVPYLYIVLTRISGLDISFVGAIKMGMITFLAGDLVKIIFVTITAPIIKDRLRRYL